MLAFAYDIADLYKVEMAVPAAFRAVKDGEEGMEGRVRRGLRDQFKEQRLLSRIVADIDRVLTVELPDQSSPFDHDAAAPGDLWDPAQGNVAGGTNYSNDTEDA
jgi:CRISPR-associated protein Cas1